MALKQNKNEEEVNRLRDDLWSVVSHKLRTPLSGAKWLVETMQNETPGILNEKQKAYMDDIHKTIDQAVALVFDLSHMVRFLGGMAPIKKEPVMIAEFFDNLLSEAKIVAAKYKVALQNGLQDGALKIETDSEILKIILRGMLDNAIEYSLLDKEVRLDAKKDADAIIFSVKDLGVGIPKNEQDQIFQRFFRASNAKKQKSNGTGLDLYVMKSLAEKIGGKIYFESEEGKGSVFYLSISAV
ncbi:MAG: HAMP domain-containing sensor histidine kinase [Patescibacteria group bacterium]